MTKTTKPTKRRKSQSASKAMLAKLSDETSVDEARTNCLSKGFVVHINGLPFRLETDAIISGHKRNFISAGLWMSSLDVG